MPPRVLLLMNDYGVRVPLWVGPGQLVGDEAGLGLDRDLLERAMAWQQHFDEAFDIKRGWLPPEEAQTHATEGRRLLHLLRTAMPSATIELDLWCVTGSRPGW